MYVRHGTKHVRAPRKRRTSENAVKRKFAVFHKSEVQLRRILIPRTSVNKGKMPYRGTISRMSGDRTGQLGSGSIYSFGETDLAAERLRVVSEVFDPTSAAFVSETVRNRPRLALDLGCGPGFTTRLLSRIARPERTVGVDRSESFLGRARASSVAREEYVAADVAMAPLRVAGIGERPDLIYARFLASHLPEPERAISGWAKTLEAGGLLLVEEVEGISTEAAAFEEYLKMLSEVLARHGNELFVGARLATARWRD